MSYIESVNEDLHRLQNRERSLKAGYEAEVSNVKAAYEEAIKDEYYSKFKEYYDRLQISVRERKDNVKSLILSLPDGYSVKEYGGKADVASKIKKSGFAEYSVDLLARCNGAAAKINAQSSPEEDAKAVESLSECCAEIDEVCSRFDEFYYSYIRTTKNEQEAAEEFSGDLDELKNRLDKNLEKAYKDAFSAVAQYKEVYRKTADTFSEESFSAQIGKQHVGFPVKICLGAVLHPVSEYRRDIVDKALSCGNVNYLPVAFEMPLVGGFGDYDSADDNRQKLHDILSVQLTKGE